MTSAGIPPAHAARHPAPGSKALAPAIGPHRVLSNRRSAALCRPGGELNWWCAPRFDSRPLLWSLLDPMGAGAAWRSTRLIRADQHPAGPTTHTVVRTGQHCVELWDGLVIVEEATVLVRLLRSCGPAVQLVHELRLGGFDQPFALWTGTDAVGLDDQVSVLGAASHGTDGQWLRSTLIADRGWTGLGICVGAQPDLGVDDLVAALHRAEREAAGSRTTRLPRYHPERGADALAVLRACTYEPTGAVVASPTASLPESPGADRQFDYRFTWLRDAGLAVSVASLLGRRDMAETYLRFLLSTLDDHHLPPGPVVAVDGLAVPEEREVPGVAGWAQSTPVRVGNAAAGQVQHDALGMVVESISVYLQTGGHLDDRTWAMVCAIAEHAITAADTPSSLAAASRPAGPGRVWAPRCGAGCWCGLGPATASPGPAAGRSWPCRRTIAAASAHRRSRCPPTRAANLGHVQDERRHVCRCQGGHRVEVAPTGHGQEPGGRRR